MTHNFLKQLTFKSSTSAESDVSCTPNSYEVNPAIKGLERFNSGDDVALEGILHLKENNLLLRASI
ncbi:hypothetical protein CHS0354_030212, partial [Potamilus streckersoni]